MTTLVDFIRMKTFLATSILVIFVYSNISSAQRSNAREIEVLGIFEAMHDALEENSRPCWGVFIATSMDCFVRLCPMRKLARWAASAACRSHRIRPVLIRTVILNEAKKTCICEPVLQMWCDGPAGTDLQKQWVLGERGNEEREVGWRDSPRAAAYKNLAKHRDQDQATSLDDGAPCFVVILHNYSKMDNMAS